MAGVLFTELLFERIFFLLSGRLQNRYTALKERPLLKINLQLCIVLMTCFSLMQLKKRLGLAIHSPCSLKLPLLSTAHIWVGLDFGGCGGKDAVKSTAWSTRRMANALISYAGHTARCSVCRLAPCWLFRRVSFNPQCPLALLQSELRLFHRGMGSMREHPSV